jgi:hypothetical protein
VPQFENEKEEEKSEELQQYYYCTLNKEAMDAKYARKR